MVNGKWVESTNVYIMHVPLCCLWCAEASRASGAVASDAQVCRGIPALSPTNIAFFLPVEIITSNLAHERHIQMRVRIDATRHDIGSSGINDACTAGRLRMA